MSSIVQGYEYDIFISYRQKDNKGDRWVSEFVESLKDELESTFKEDVTVYFDINPHDGLSETYLVDKTIENKLKCLILIPIISRTYCDSKSFAWQNEFMAFNKLARDDKFGRDIRLTGGNVVSRILPVKIHDLDQEDKILLESELGAVLRPVEFIYKSSGVNRPLKPDDSRTENLNHSYYRDQINKVANAVNEIITGLKNFDTEKKVFSAGKTIQTSDSSKKKKSFILKTAIWAFIFIALIATGYFLLPAISKTSAENIDKSIAVLPFDNMSNDHDQEYFGNGIMQEILNHLFKIGGLQIPSSTSSMRYKGSKLSVKEIARELNVSYVLEGNVSRSGDNVRIIVRMVSGKDERLIWTEDYKKSMTATNLLEIQSDIAQQVAEKMNVEINPEVKKKIESKPTLNTEAYTLFLQTATEFLPFDQAKSKLERAIFLDPAYSDAYAQLAYYWLHEGGYEGKISREQVLEKAEPLVDKALELNNNSLVAHVVKASLRLYYYWDFESVEKELMVFDEVSLINSNLEFVVSEYLISSGKYHEALTFNLNALNQNKKKDNWVELALSYNYDNQSEKAITTINTARELFPESEWVFTNLIRLLIYQENYYRTLELFEKSITDKDLTNLEPTKLALLGIAYYKSGDKTRSKEFLEELFIKSGKSAVGSPFFYAAALYASMEEKEKALHSLEKAFSDHEVEMFWLKVDPLFKPLHGDPRFENILKKIGFN